jgi:hypothetical protein
MISTILILLSFCLGALVILLSTMDAWLRADQQRALRDWFEATWVRVADADPLRFALQPLLFLSLLLDRMLGATLSWQAFKRAFIISTLFLISLLSFVGMLSLVPSAKISTPWALYSESTSMARDILNNPNYSLNDPTMQIM